MKFFSYVVVADIVMTFLFFVTYGLSASELSTVKSAEDAVRFATSRDGLYYVLYLNVVLLTLTTAVVFSGLYLYTRKQSPALAITGLVITPVYAFNNLFVYGSQLILVPRIFAPGFLAELPPGSELVLAHLVQAWEDSAIFMMNNAGYALLGVACIAFGAALARMGGLDKAAGIILVLTGVLCIIALIFIVAGPMQLGMVLSMAGGLLTLVAFVVLALLFYRADHVS